MTEMESKTVEPFGRARTDIAKVAELLEGIRVSIAEQMALTPEEQQARQSAIVEQIKSIEKRDQYGQFLMRIETEAEFLRTREKELAARRHSLEEFARMVREALHEGLVNLGVRRLGGFEHVFSIRKNPPRLEIVDETKIPAEFVDWHPIIQRKAIKDALERGEAVPGCELVTSTRLDVR